MMKRIVVLPLLLLIFAFDSPGKKKIKIFLAGDSTISIKESRVYPETGWGMPFVWFWDSTVIVVNQAKNGRSTKTFISEGLWKSIYDNAGEGDYVLIQFGHNDESKDKGERYAPPEEYKANLARFIKETRERKAHPILITPVSRRKFDSTGKIMETHLVYSALVREVAAAEQVPLIDLDRKSQALYQQFGKDASKWLFLQLKPGEHPNYPEGRDDNTHFSELGARLIAQIVLADLRQLAPELTERIVVPKPR